MIVKKPYSIAQIVKTTPEVTLFKFRSVDGGTLDFDPGMFVMLTHRDQQTGTEIARAFSLASPPGGQTIDFTISMIHGRFTSKLDSAKDGDIYYVTGPYGQFKLDSTRTKVLFLAGGTGIAPFLSMFYFIKEKALQFDIAVVYSVRHPDEIILKEELEALSKELKINMAVTVTRQENTEGWHGEKGHIDSAMISRHVPDVTQRECYVCGPLAFVKAMKDALGALDVPKEEVKADVWG